MLVLQFLSVVFHARTVDLNECKQIVEQEKFIAWGDTTGEQVLPYLEKYDYINVSSRKYELAHLL